MSDNLPSEWNPDDITESKAYKVATMMHSRGFVTPVDFEYFENKRFALPAGHCGWGEADLLENEQLDHPKSPAMVEGMMSLTNPPAFSYDFPGNTYLDDISFTPSDVMEEEIGFNLQFDGAEWIWAAIDAPPVDCPAAIGDDEWLHAALLEASYEMMLEIDVPDDAELDDASLIAAKKILEAMQRFVKISPEELAKKLLQVEGQHDEVVSSFLQMQSSSEEWQD